MSSYGKSSSFRYQKTGDTDQQLENVGQKQRSSAVDKILSLSTLQDRKRSASGEEGKESGASGPQRSESLKVPTLYSGGSLGGSSVSSTSSSSVGSNPRFTPLRDRVSRSTSFGNGTHSTNVL